MALVAYAYVKKSGTGILGGEDSTGLMSVLVAAEDISERRVVSGKMFVSRPISAALFSEGMVARLDPAATYYARHPMIRGEILYESRLGNAAEEPELSYMVDRDQGVITLGVTDVTGISGLLKPGDYVDVYATYSRDQLAGQEKQDRTESITRRIVSGCKVVATGREVLSPVKGGSRPEADRFDRKREMDSLKRVTLAVSDTDMEKIIYAYTNGKIHLALKSDEEQTPTGRHGYSNHDLQNELFTTIECIRADRTEWVRVDDR